MRRWVQRIAIAGAVGVVLLAAALLLLQRLASAEIAPYEAVLGVPEADLQAGRRSLESELTALASDNGSAPPATGPAERPPSSIWRLDLAQQEVNGWLATRTEKFAPQLAEGGIYQPRVLFNAGDVVLAFRYESSWLHSVVSLQVKPMALEDGTLGIALCGASAGKLPLPLGRIVSEAQRALAEANLPIRWRTHEGNPLAVIDFELLASQPGIRRTLQGLQCEAGELKLWGEIVRVAPPTSPAATPTQQQGEIAWPSPDKEPSP